MTAAAPFQSIHDSPIARVNVATRPAKDFEFTQTYHVDVAEEASRTRELDITKGVEAARELGAVVVPPQKLPAAEVASTKVAALQASVDTAKNALKSSNELHTTAMIERDSMARDKEELTLACQNSDLTFPQESYVVNDQSLGQTLDQQRVQIKRTA